MAREKVNIQFKKLHPDAVIPKFQTEGASGFDLHAVIDQQISMGVPGVDNPINLGRGIVIQPHSQELIRTGLATAVPIGFEMQIRPRSGLAAKHQVTVTNSPGTLDADYRGEIKIILINHADTPFAVEHGDRIAQGVIAPVPEVTIEEVNELSTTERGAGGFGSTGTK